MELRGRRLSSQAFAAYENFSVDFKTTPDRSSFTAWLMNLGQVVLADPRNRDEAR